MHNKVELKGFLKSLILRVAIKLYEINVFRNLIKLNNRLNLNVLISKKSKVYGDKILIIKCDSLGDVVLFMPFLRFITIHPTYKNYNFDLLLDEKNKGIDEVFAKYNINVNTIWVNTRLLGKDQKYFCSVLEQIRNSGYSKLLNPIYSREIWPEICHLVKYSAIPERVAFLGDTHSVYYNTLKQTASYYTQFINTNPEIKFEWYRNLDVLHCLIDDEQINMTDLLKPFRLNQSENKQISIFIGAGNKSRKWDVENYKRLTNFLLQKTNHTILIIGGAEDSLYAAEFPLGLRVKNLCGKTKIIELFEIIFDSMFIISNETSAIHIAALANRPFYCISNGNHYIRFNPYPAEFVQNGSCFYPNEIKEYFGEAKMLGEWYKYYSNLDINEINISEIIGHLNKVFK